LPVEKAAEVLNELGEACDAPILLIGAPKELPHVSAALALVRQPQRFENLAGKTSMVELVDLFSSTPVMLTTDSGPMHLANSLGVHTVALEGASDERNTAPFNAEKSTLLRFGQLPCEPCVRNTCQFGIPKCLIGIDNQRIVTAVISALKNSGCD
jgi:ADP-heptose:LPS heptosyltransferase